MSIAGFVWSMTSDLSGLRRDLARVERKLDFILKRLDISFDEGAMLSERVKELAREPKGKIKAMKIYREETGAKLREAKEMVETYIQSLQQ